ncbi:MAG TPA: arginine--tRNA ligase, partial [Bacteroidales bacterium]|nr:arginine--tRNA ligase [Bacteroidales bacterium]
MESFLKENICKVVKELYNAEVNDDIIQIQETRKDFKGDFTLIVFPLLRFSKNTPEKTGETIGSQLMASFPEISGYNVIKGFLNIEISDKWWISYFARMMAETDLLKNCRV